MKTLKILGIFLYCGLGAIAQPLSGEDNFVVIGSFKNLNNAKRFISEIHRNGLNAHCALRSSLDLYYVYLLQTNDRSEAVNLLTKIKSENGFRNAWIFHGNFDSEKKSLDSSITGFLVEPTLSPRTESKPFYFRLVSNADEQEIIGNLLIQETNESSGVWVRSGEPVSLKKPQNEHQSFKVTVMVKGYNERSLICFYNKPADEDSTNNHEAVVTIDLVKSRGENFIDFDNVYFIGNSSFLRTSSEQELKSLVYFMEANPDDKIIIHGHCTQKQQEKFLEEQRICETSNFKDLSVARAEATKFYLVQQGIDPSRILTFGNKIDPDELYESKKSNTVEIEFIKNNSIQTL